MAYSNNDRQMASLAMQMMAKVQLSGQEVGAFVAVNNWLQAIMATTMQPTVEHAPSDATHIPKATETFS